MRDFRVKVGTVGAIRFEACARELATDQKFIIFVVISLLEIRSTLGSQFATLNEILIVLLIPPAAVP